MMSDEHSANSLKSWAIQELSDSAVDSPALDADILLSHVSGLERSHVLAYPDKSVPPQVKDEFARLVKNRKKLTPVAYLTGIREFYSLSFKVSPAVLIPRPETELLVETALSFYSSTQTPKILDIGTGSGAIAIALTVNRKKWRVTATDIVSEALITAKENAETHGVSDRIEFVRSNIFRPMSPRDPSISSRDFDLIVSNPPYIPEGDDNVTKEVSLYEPREALYSGRDGLYHIRSIIKDAASYLSSEGRVMLEIGYGQADAVKSLVDNTPSLILEKIIPDLAGIDRVVVAKKNSNG